MIEQENKKQPSTIIRNLLKNKPYGLLCGVYNAHYYIIIIKKDILDGHCREAAILNSYKIGTIKEAQKIYQVLKYHEPTCQKIYYPDVPQQRRRTNRCGLFCVEYIRNMNTDILRSIFRGHNPHYNINAEIIERNVHEYLEIITNYAPTNQTESTHGSVQVHDASMKEKGNDKVNDDDYATDSSKQNYLRDNMKIIKRKIIFSSSSGEESSSPPRHKRRKSNRKIFKCSFCGNTFTEKRNKIRHEQSVHKKTTQIICEICDKMYLRSDSLKIHKNKVHGIE